VTEVSRKAMILIKPEPHYTEDARQKKLRGNVVLRAVLSASGKLTNIQVVSGVPELAQSSIESAGKMFFIPAMKDGRFVSTPIELQYNFSLF
jgi:TonB family protein